MALDPYTRAMFGCYAVHVPAWLKVQDQGDGGVSFVGASRSLDLRYGSERAHQLIIGELIVRPHLVIGSDAFIGAGLSGLATEMDVEKWVDGDIIVDQMGRAEKLKSTGS